MDLHSFFYTLVKHSSSHDHDTDNVSNGTDSQSLGDEMYLIDKIFEMDVIDEELEEDFESND